jgi:hypothetical protein
MNEDARRPKTLSEKLEILSVVNTIVGLLVGIIKLVSIGASFFSQFGHSLILVLYYIGLTELYVLIFGFIIMAILDSMGVIVQGLFDIEEIIAWIVIIAGCFILALFRGVNPNPFEFWGAAILGFATFLYAVYAVVRVVNTKINETT